jgi:hypothetical protein
VTVIGEQEIRTKVYHVLPENQTRLDVGALLREAQAELGRAAGTRQEAWVL